MNNVTVLRHHCIRFLPGKKQPKHPEWQHHGKDYPPFQSIFSGSLVGQRLRVSCYHDPTHVMPVLINSSVFGERSKPDDRRPLPRKCCSTAMPAASVSEGPVPSASRDTMVPIRIRPALAVFPGVAVFPATIPVQGCSLSCRRCLCRDKENRVISGVEMAELNAVA